MYTKFIQMGKKNTKIPKVKWRKNMNKQKREI